MPISEPPPHTVDESIQQSATRRQRRRAVTSLVLFSLCVALQASASITSYQIANIGTALCGILSVAFLYRWWWCRPGISKIQRLLPACGSIFALGIGASLFELKGVNGELVPQFRYRFAPVTELLVESDIDANPSLNLRLSIDGSAYPGFLGRDRRGVMEERAFSIDPQELSPSLRWKHPLGAGLAGISVAFLETPNGPSTGEPSDPSIERLTTVPSSQQLLYTMEQRNDEEWITCYSAVDGNLRWHHAYPAFHTHFLGDTGPRSTPTIDQQGRVFTLGAAGRVCCLDGLSGKLLWTIDLLKVAGITQASAEQGVTWGRAASPLRVDDLVILPLGGEDSTTGKRRTLIALDAASGEIRWTSGEHQISYASPVIATLCGIRQIISVDEDFVSATDPSDGTVLWTYPWPGKSNAGANCSNPIPLGTNRVLLTKEYGGGALMLHISQKEGQFHANPIWESSQLLKTKFTNAVIQGSFAYGLSDGTLECVNIDSGERQWKQTRRQRLGHGHVLLVKDCLVCSSEEGEIVMVRATPSAYEEIYRFSALTGKTWNPFAIVDNSLYLRNGEEIAAWELTPAR